MKFKFKASVTVFVSLSLGSFILFILFIIFSCINMSEKVRFEGIYDISMNSAIGEYSLALSDIYNLYYIDSSYLSGPPGEYRLEEHISDYAVKNAEGIIGGPYASVWGRVNIDSVELLDFQTATAYRGASMRRQATDFVNNAYELKKKYAGEVSEVFSSGSLLVLESPEDILQQWNALMETIADMKLPVRKNMKTGISEEIMLANPADWVFGLSGSDIMFLSGVKPDCLSDSKADLSRVSSNCAVNFKSMSSINSGDEFDYYIFLMDKMGCFLHEKEDRDIKYELEYIAEGSSSDMENLKKAVNRIYKARLFDNYRLAKEDARLNNEAYAIAAMIEVCLLAPEFIKPVAESIIYACAYLETISDMHSILTGGKVPLEKTDHSMSIESVLCGNRYFVKGDNGLSYRQYLLAMIALKPESIVNLRSMDLMELTVRKETGNVYFSMDWCIERFRTRFTAGGSQNKNMVIDRIYGLY